MGEGDYVFGGISMAERTALVTDPLCRMVGKLVLGSKLSGSAGKRLGLWSLSEEEWHLSVVSVRSEITGVGKCSWNGREEGMAKTTLGGVEIEVDEDGFIQEPGKWTAGIAEDVAKREGVFPMTEDHWKVINYLRDYYLRFEIAPPIRMLCKQTGMDLKKIYKLFPSGPAKGACKIAGLPKPTGCV